MADQNPVNKGKVPSTGAKPAAAAPKPAPKQKEKKDNMKAVLLGLVVLLVIGNGVLGFMLMNSKDEAQTAQAENAVLSTEKAELTSELDAMIMQYDSLETDNETLMAEREQRISEIEELKAQVQEVEDIKYLNYKLRKEASTLRGIMKGYIHTIDSLNTLNIALRDDNRGLQTDLAEARHMGDSLSAQNETLSDKVAIGARLNASDITVTALRIKSNNEARPTSRASKTQKIKCCFTIEANPLTEPGTKTLYMRISGSGGFAIKAKEQEGEPEFDMGEGVKGFYAKKKDVDYAGKELEVCTYYNVPRELPIGKYKIELYESGQLMGKSELLLK